MRGLHFQTPLIDHVKFVYCPSGKVMDVAAGLRKNSATFGKHTTCILEGGKGNNTIKVFVGIRAASIGNATRRFFPTEAKLIRCLQNLIRRFEEVFT